MTTPVIWLTDGLKALGTTKSPDKLTQEQRDNARELVLNITSVIELYTSRRFDPYYETRYYNPASNSNGGDIAPGGYLLLDEDLWELTELVNNGTETVSPTNYALFPLQSSAKIKDMIRLKNSLYWNGSNSADNFDAIHVTGLWGGGGGSFKAKTTITSDMDETQMTMEVGSFSGMELGQLYRLGSELVLVANEPDDATISIERAHNGSQSAAHSTGDTLELFRSNDSVRLLARRMFKWQLALDDNPLIALVTIGDAQEPIDLSAAPKDVQDLLEALTRPDRLIGV